MDYEYEGDAYLCGREAYRQGYEIGHNPYPQDTKNAVEWVDGWIDEKDQPRRDINSGTTSTGSALAERDIHPRSDVRRVPQPQKHAQSA